MFPVIQIGPMALQTPGLILLIGLWLGLILAERLAPRFQANANQVYNLVFVALITGVVGARVSYVLRYYEAFIQNPSNIFSLNPGLLDSVGGAAIGLTAAMVYGNRKEISWWSTLDAITPFFSGMIIAYGFSNLASGDAFGAETSLPWAIDLWGMKRHPTQIYQILTGCLTLGFIWFKARSSGEIQHVPGETFIGFMALSTGAWLFIAAFRGDSMVLPNGVRVSQITAWLVLAASLWGLGKLHRQERDEIIDRV